MKRLLILLAFPVSLAANAQGQFCGTDQLRDAQIATNPSLLQREWENDLLLHDYLTAVHTQEKTVVTVPVVFHILHQNGPENISDAMVIQAVDELNLRFQNAAPYSDASGNPVGIQFCLASVDPWGNPTTGITHDYSPIITINYPDPMEDVALKNVNRWNPDVYLNVWTVSYINGAGGYATYPYPDNHLTDGIVARYNTLTNSSLLAHEAGHYFNLYHTFTGGCGNANCLLDGDRVCDTPPDASSNYAACPENSCSTEMSDTSGSNPFTGDMADVPNYMDYTVCPLSFTAGQASRMEAALDLLRPTLLLSNGCGANPGGAMPVAAFTVDSSYCKGTGKYGFASVGANCQYIAWDFENDGSIDTLGQNVVHRFTASGTYQVKLFVSGYGGSDTSVQLLQVFVAPNLHYPILENYSGTTVDPILGTPFACSGDLITAYGVPGMASYLWNTGETTQAIPFVIDSTTELTLTVTNSSGETFTTCMPLQIRVNNFQLVQEVGSDTVDCGELVTLRLLPVAHWFPATNTWYRNGGWYSENQFVVSSYGTPPGNNSVWVLGNVDPIGCVTDSDTVTYFVRDPVRPVLSFSGNSVSMSYDCITAYWYRDGVPLNGNDSSIVITQNGCYWADCISCMGIRTDTLCITNLGLGENAEWPAVTVFPNPFGDVLRIVFGTEQNNVHISLTDMQGKELRSVLFSGSELQLETDRLRAGIYLLVVTDERGKRAVRRVEAW